MYKLPVFTFNEEYKLSSYMSYMLNFLNENLAPCGGYAFNNKTKRILVNKFNCTYENSTAGDVDLHYLNFTREEDRTFFLLRFS
jgi:23S rRNA maturation mini-RNase III